jgi:hypothetical protein
VIDFRYHLVSIIAVFLALAVGLLVGSTYLSGVNETILSNAQKALTKANDSLTTKNASQKQQLSADQAFAQAAARRLLNGLLTGQKVVLVEAPNTDNQMTTGLITALQEAGASVTGTVVLQPTFFDDGGQTESSLTQLAQQLAPQAGVTLPASPAYPSVAGQEAASAVIAASIANKNGINLTGSGVQSVLSGFAQNGYLAVQNLPSTGTAALDPATMAVVLTPGGTASPPTSQALVALAAQLKLNSLATVMAGSLSGIQPGSPISLEGSSGPVSTVDNADTESGQIMVVQTMKNVLDGQAPTSYGVEPGTAPSPAPTPSTTQTSGTTGSRRKHK